VLTRAVLRRLAIVWVLCVITVSLQSVRPGSTRGRTLQHEISHILVFGATGLMFLTLARNNREEWTAAAGVVCLGISIEFGQWVIYGLPGYEWWDVREDTIGVLLAIALVRTTRIRPVVLSDKV
jgi:hypothetical protein